MTRLRAAFRPLAITLLVTLGSATVVAADDGASRTRRAAPRLPRSGDPAIIKGRLAQTVELLKQAIAMQEEPRTRDAIVRADAVLYSAYKYLGSAYTGVEIRMDRMARKNKLVGHDPLLEVALKTLARARDQHVRTAMNRNDAGDAAGTIQASRSAIALIEQVMETAL
ncbi:MAG TPA: hypothetical protein VNN07_13020 [Candidatus Tectomicrobia bacterium]|nr:hypothetical protein [Candidatus Tectomicrobia bacterium]